MKAIISRTSRYGDDEKPCDEAVLESLTYLDYRTVATLEEAEKQFWYNQWLNDGENHREENGMVVCDKKIKFNNEPIRDWVIEFDNIIDLYKKYGALVIDRSPYKEYDLSIEIYDSYRE